MLEVVFRPTEPCVFQGPGEFSPRALIADNIRAAYSWPRLPTLLGALCTSLYFSDPKYKSRVSTSRSWEENVDSILQDFFGKNYKILGMYVRYNNRIYLPVCEQYLVELEFLRRLFARVSWNDFVAAAVDPKNKKKDWFEVLLSAAGEDPEKEVLRRDSLRKLGIQLVPLLKQVEEQHLYYIEYVYYKTKNNENVAPWELEYVLLVEGEQTSSFKAMQRLGAEGRYALLAVCKASNPLGSIVKGKEDVLDRLGFNSFLQLKDAEEKVWITLTPVVLHENVLSFVLYEEFAQAVIAQVLERLGVEGNAVKLLGKVDCLGGYDILRNIKKPLLPVFQEGSIVWITQ
ncbi:MAG: hypothetical protein GXO42_00780 [bacterium]|nr:hypothetical protein [bacterium]